MFGIDYTGTETLRDLVEDMREGEVEVRLARVHEAARERLEASGLIATLGDGRIFRRVEDAVGGA